MPRRDRKQAELKSVVARAASVIALLVSVVVASWDIGNPLQPWKDTGPEGKAILIGFLVSIVFAVWYYRRGARKVEYPFHCRKCGYDLTGNRSGRCPECGESILDGSS